MTRINWIIALTATFVLALVVADLAATKQALLLGATIPGGVFLFSVIFVVRDALHRAAGAAFVKRVIWIGAALNLLAALYLWVIARLEPAPFFELNEPWAQIFSMAPGIVIGSVAAAVSSQLVSTALFQRLTDRGYPLWWRVIGSNLASLPIDGVVFTVVGFVVLPHVFGGPSLELAEAAARLASGQTLVKLATVVVMTPVVYLTPALERHQQPLPHV